MSEDFATKYGKILTSNYLVKIDTAMIAATKKPNSIKSSAGEKNVVKFDSTLILK
jgi:hypothetical protein